MNPYSFISALRESSGVILYFARGVKRSVRRTLQFQPPLPSDRDRPSRRQPLDLRGPLDGKPTVADLEDDPVADYVVSGGRGGEIGHALPQVRVFVRHLAGAALPALLCCQSHRR